MAFSVNNVRSVRGCLGRFQRMSMLESYETMQSYPNSVPQRRRLRIPKTTFHYDVEKPKFEMTKYDPEGLFSPAIRRFMAARYLENDGGHPALVTNFKDAAPVGMIHLNMFVFGVNPRIDIIHRVMVWQRACMRAGTACVKNRAQVRGGGRKPWPQKGTGRARQGSIRAPHFRGGGVVHGPIPRSYKYNLPSKVQRMGLRSILSCRYAQGDLHIVENFNNLSPYEEDILPILKKRGWTRATLIDGFENETLKSSTANMQKVMVNNCLDFNVLDILNTDKVIMSLEAVEFIENRLCEDNRIINEPLYQFVTVEPLDERQLKKIFEERRQEKQAIQSESL